jgi:hypothetical protein
VADHLKDPEIGAESIHYKIQVEVNLHIGVDHIIITNVAVDDILALNSIVIGIRGTLSPCSTYHYHLWVSKVDRQRLL